MKSPREAATLRHRRRLQRACPASSFRIQRFTSREEKRRANRASSRISVAIIARNNRRFRNEGGFGDDRLLKR